MLQVLLNGIIVGGVYALISIGFALIYSSLRFHNLAYGAIAFFGAYLTYSFTEIFHLNFFFSLFLSSLIFGFLSLAFWKIFYKPFYKKNASSVTMIVASFGMLIILQNIIALIFDNSAKSVSITDHLIPAYNIFGLSITLNQIVILSFTIVIGIIFEFVMTRTKFGLAIQATGQNKELATIIGVDPDKVINYSFFIATFLSVFGASLISLEIGLRPTYGLTMILKVIIACIIGGMGKIKGAILGGFMLGIIENFGIYYFGITWQDIFAFVILILFLIFRPRGIFK